jgi:aspartate/methionine/tyrosine aminotransferase
MPLNVRSLPPGELEFQMFVMDELADAANAAGEDVIKLTIGITDLPVPERVRNVIAEAVHDPVHTRLVYPQGLPALRKAVARYYRDRFAADVDAEHVVVNTGTSPIFRNLFQLLSRPGQEILIPRPYYCLYKICGLLAGARVTYYDIDLATRRVDLRSFRRAFHPARTAVVVLNNPGNPIGNVLTRDEVVEIYRVVDGQAYVVNDEIYNNCCFYEPFECPLSYLPGPARRVTVVTNGFSKGFRLYTKRVGYALLPDELVMPMRIVQQHTLLTHDPVTQAAALEALRDEAGPRELTAVYRRRAEYAYDQLTGTGCRPVRTDGGFYVVLDCGGWPRAGRAHDTVELARDLIERARVATVPGTDFGAPHTLRLSLCSSRFEEGIDRLRAYFTAVPAARWVNGRPSAERTAGEPGADAQPRRRNRAAVVVPEGRASAERTDPKGR